MDNVKENCHIVALIPAMKFIAILYNSNYREIIHILTYAREGVFKGLDNVKLRELGKQIAFSKYDIYCRWSE